MASTSDTRQESLLLAINSASSTSVGVILANSPLRHDQASTCSYCITSLVWRRFRCKHICICTTDSREATVSEGHSHDLPKVTACVSKRHSMPLGQNCLGPDLLDQLGVLSPFVLHTLDKSQILQPFHGYRHMYNTGCSPLHVEKTSLFPPLPEYQSV